jgi:DUF1009 family protein
MGLRIGLIAGSGRFPLQALAGAKARGYSCVVAGIRGEAPPEIKAEAEAFEWVGPTELEKLVTFFKAQGVTEAVLAGKVEPRTLLRKDVRDEALSRLLSGIGERTPTGVLRSLIEFLTGQGIRVMDPSFLLAPFFCPPGRLSKAEPSAGVLEDAAVGRLVARAAADLEIGQTVAVKNGAIVAVEGMEGTDEAIRRAGRLAGDGIVVAKAGRTRQDMRIDVPAVGLETVKALVSARAAALVFEAAAVPFFQKDEALALADAHGLVVLAES